MRDNVIFEFGLFAGRLGREHVYILQPRDAGDGRVPTDLEGLVTIRYEVDSDGQLVVEPVAATIVEQIRARGRRPRRTSGHANARVRVFDFYDLTDRQEAMEYYEALGQTIRVAKENIYRSGRGFSEIRPEHEKQIDLLISSERAALSAGVRICRIQTARRTGALWSDQYSRLMEEFPELLTVWADYSDPPLVNVAVVDPTRTDGMIQLLFESHEFVSTTEKYKAATAMFLFGRIDVATGLQRQFIERVGRLRKLSPTELRRLGATTLYFAYGSNLATTQMRLRCPSASLVGGAVLYGWRLAFTVSAPHLRGATATIERGEPHEHVWGALWELTEDDRRKLDDAERGGYEPHDVDVKAVDDRESVAAFSYVAIKPSTRALKPADSYVDAMLEGAAEHSLSELEEELLKLRRTLA